MSRNGPDELARLLGDIVLNLELRTNTPDATLRQLAQAIDSAVVSKSRWRRYETAVAPLVAPIVRREVRHGHTSENIRLLRNLTDAELEFGMKGPFADRSMKDLREIELEKLALNLVALDELRLAIRDDMPESWIMAAVDAAEEDAGRAGFESSSDAAKRILARLVDDGIVVREEEHECESEDLPSALLASRGAGRGRGRTRASGGHGESRGREDLHAIETDPPGRVSVSADDPLIRWGKGNPDARPRSDLLVHAWYGTITTVLSDGSSKSRDVMRLYLRKLVSVRDHCHADIQILDSNKKAKSEVRRIDKDEVVDVEVKEGGYRLGDILRITFVCDAPAYSFVAEVPMIGKNESKM